MNLSTHAALIWRHRGVAFAGIALSAVLAFLAAYAITGRGVERRGVETWASESSVLVTQRGFPWGRVTLPGTGAPAQVATPSQAGNARIQFADPSRFSNLAVLYSIISDSDRVRSMLSGNPKPEQIVAGALDPSGSGNATQPIIRLQTKGATPAEALSLNRQTLAGLSLLLTQEQDQAGIPAKDRVVLSTLNHPSRPILTDGPSWAPALLALVLGLLATVALLHILEAVRRRGAWVEPEAAAPLEVLVPPPPRQRSEPAVTSQ